MIAFHLIKNTWRFFFFVRHYPRNTSQFSTRKNFHDPLLFFIFISPSSLPLYLSRKKLTSITKFLPFSDLVYSCICLDINLIAITNVFPQKKNVSIFSRLLSSSLSYRTTVDISFIHLYIFFSFEGAYSFYFMSLNSLSLSLLLPHSLITLVVRLYSCCRCYLTDMYVTRRCANPRRRSHLRITHIFSSSST